MHLAGAGSGFDEPSSAERELKGELGFRVAQVYSQDPLDPRETLVDRLTLDVEPARSRGLLTGGLVVGLECLDQFGPMLLVVADEGLEVRSYEPLENAALAQGSEQFEDIRCRGVMPRGLVPPAGDLRRIERVPDGRPELPP